MQNFGYTYPEKAHIIYINTVEQTSSTVTARANLPVAKYAIIKTRMWTNSQRDGRTAEYRWRPLFQETTGQKYNGLPYCIWAAIMNRVQPCELSQWLLSRRQHRYIVNIDTGIGLLYAASQYYVDAAYFTDGVAWSVGLSVCLSVCLSVSHDRKPCKNG